MDYFHFRRAMSRCSVGAEGRSQSRRALQRISRHASRSRDAARGRSTSVEPAGSRGSSRSRDHSAGATHQRSASRGRGAGAAPRRPVARPESSPSEEERPPPPRPTVAAFVDHAAGEGRGRAASVRRTGRSCSRPRADATSPEPQGDPAASASHGPATPTTPATPASRPVRAPLPQVEGDSGQTLLRTVVCSHFRNGYCAFGNQCSFAHPGSIDCSRGIAGVPQRERKRAAKAGRLERERSRERAEQSEEQRREALLQAFESQLQDAEPSPEVGSPEAEPTRGVRPAPCPPAQPARVEEASGVAEAASGRSLHFAEPGPPAAEAAVHGPILEDDGPGNQDPRRRLLGLFESEPWDVLLSDSAFEHLQSATRPQQKAVLQILKALASGHWSEGQRKEVAAHGPLKLRRAHAHDFNVLWGIDVEFSRERDSFVEVLQVWDVVDEERFEEARCAIQQEWQQSRRSFQGLQKAFQRQRLKAEADTRLPRVVPRSDLQDQDVFSVRKFFSLDKQMLRSILFESASRRGAVSAGEQFPLRISKQEAAVIEKPGPMIVIGRSGSGKTLCCVYRMFFQHQAYWRRAAEAGGAPLLPSSSPGGGLVHLHQVFVTHSASLANKVLEYFSNLQGPAEQAAPAASVARVGVADTRPRSRLVEQSRLPESLQGVRAFPIFVTFRKLLVMIDGCTAEPFFPRRPGGSVQAARVDLAEPLDALDPLSALHERRRAAQRAQALGAPGVAGHGRDAVLTEVDYELFRRRFWPKLCQKCPPACDPSLVWREIQSYIKGSYRVLDSPRGSLSLSEYQEVAKKCSPAFDEYRGQIHDAFKAYEELRKQWNCFDRMDACLHVIRQLQREPYSGPPIHEVAVDEVQDLAQLELAVFFLVTKRPYEGLFITGDTSQTVSRAVDFRFCDLRSVFHHFGVPPPEIDQLIVNYRSHQKILALSYHGVVRPLELAFPHSVDKLEPDLGHRDGPQPIIVTDVRLEDLTKHLFNLNGSAGGIAFGASQCILVRSEAAKAKLPEELQGALVLTVEQSKGLEFDDVILVNFFADSAYSEWQVMRNFREDLLERQAPSAGEPRRQPHFERYRHTMLCSELKHLYTAMTRTKEVLLLIEQDSRRAQSSFDLWDALGLVSFGLLAPDSLSAIDSLIKRAGEAKGEESWKAVGLNLLQKQLFEQARSCFMRARDESMAKVCEAYLLARRAAETSVDSEMEAITLYLQAAELFHDAGNAERERAVCLLHGNRPLEAAHIFEALGPELRAETAHAFDCGGEHRRAGEIYEELGSYREALDSLTQVDAPTEVKRVVLRAYEAEAMKADECFRYLQDMESHDVAAELYLREEDYAQAATCFQSAGLLEQEAECYMRLGQIQRAADVMCASSDPALLRRAADLYVNLDLRSAAATCYQSLLKHEGVADRERLLRVCAELQEDLEQWSLAAGLWEQLQQTDALDRAIDCYKKAGKLADAASVCEKKAAQQTSFFQLFGTNREREQILKCAAEWYEKGGSLEHALRVWADLGEWDTCGRLAREQSKFPEAADYFRKAGRPNDQVDCLIWAEDFESALGVLQRSSYPDVTREVKCLQGMGRFYDAARKQMQALPQMTDDESHGCRGKLALKAFDLAKRDTSRWKSFLAEFEHEMPDPISTIMYFAEMTAVDELVAQLKKQQRPLAAAGAASVLGHPSLALDQLLSLAGRLEAGSTADVQDDLPDDFDIDVAVLEVIQVALGCSAQCLNSDLSCDLERACSWLAERGSVSTSQLELVKVVVKRRSNDHSSAGKGQSIADRDAATVRRVLEVRSANKKPPCWKARADEEVALAPGAGLADIEEALQGLERLRRMAAAHAHRVEHSAKELYSVCPALHRHFLNTMDEFCKASRLPSLQTSGSALLIPSSHVLARPDLVAKLQVLPAVVQLTDLRSAILEDLEGRQEQLLGRLAALKEQEAAVLTIPKLWVSVRDTCRSEDRRVRLQAGLVQAVRAACQKAAKAQSRFKALDQEVQDLIPECARDVWASAYTAQRDVLRDPRGKDFIKASGKLREAVHEVATMFRVHAQSMTRRGDGVVVKEVMDLVLSEMRDLLVICPHHVELRCQWNGNGCACEHPPVPQTTNPWWLLNCEDKASKYPDLVGIGLQGWIDIASICYDSVRYGVCKHQTCRWKHLAEDKLAALRKELGPNCGDVRGYKTKQLAVKILSGGDNATMPRHMRDGFGFTFFEDEDLTENVRLVSLLAQELNGRRTQCDFAVCRSLLLRMCRAAYRFPEIQAVETVRQVLGQLRPEDLDALSAEITKEVFGSESDHGFSLLGQVLRNGPKPPQPAPKKVLQRPQGSALNPGAPEFVPRQQQQRVPPPMRVDRWAQGDAASHLFMPQVPTAPAQNSIGQRPAGQGRAQGTGAGWRPTLRPVGADPAQ